MITVQGVEGPPFKLLPPQAMASPKPSKPVQPAPSSRMRLGRLLMPVCLSRPFFSSSKSSASSAGHTRTLPVLSTPTFSGRWETRAANGEDKGQAEERVEGELGVMS